MIGVRSNSRSVSSVVEHFVHTEGVTSSNLVPSTIILRELRKFASLFHLRSRSLSRKSSLANTALRSQSDGMPRVTLEPTFDEKKGLWCLYLGPKLSPGKVREYRKEKADILERAKYWKHYRDAGQKAALRAGPDLITKAVHYDELLRDVYGFEGGLAEFCELKLTELDKQLESPPFRVILEEFEKASCGSWSASTKETWKWIRNGVKDLEETPLATLTIDFWRERLEKMADERNWSPRAFNDFCSRLASAYNYSIPNLLQANPLDGVKKRKVPKNRKTIWTLEQIEAVLMKAWNDDRDMLPYFAIGVFAGLRPESELTKLKWENISWENGHIVVAEEFDNKTGVKRFVPLNDNLRAWLEPWRAVGATGPILPPCNLYKRRRKTTGGIAPTGKGADNDVMRHTYGSYMDAATGHDRNGIKEWMGHTDFQTFEQNYRDACTPEQGKAFLEILPPQ